MMNKSRLISSVVCLLISLHCFGATITVDDDAPADFSSIQEAIDFALDGDVVEVQPGIYTESINFYGKEITVTSTNIDNPSETQIIQPSQDIPAVRFDSGESATSILQGFKFTAASRNAKVIVCYHSSPTIRSIEIHPCSSGCPLLNPPFSLTGIYGENASPTIQDCLLKNLNESNGGAIVGCNGTILRCQFVNCYNATKNCHGIIKNCLLDISGINNCDGSISNCTIYSSSSDAIVACNGLIKNNIIVGSNGYGIPLPIVKTNNSFV